MQLKIIEELKKIIEPLTGDEYSMLEQSILEEGIRDPIMLWKDNTIVDGHNRYEIAVKHGLEFKVVYKEFESISDIKVWILHNSLGRRSLTKNQRTKYIGDVYNKLKKKGFKGNQYTESSNSHNEKHQILVNILADKEGVSHCTVSRAAVYSNNIDTIKELDSEVATDILSGKIKSTKKEVSGFINQTPDKQKQLIKIIKEGNDFGVATDIVKKEENKRKIIIDRHTTLLNVDSNLHLGDCLEVLNSIPDKSIDMCLTDPPFGINFVSKYRIEKYKEITNDNEGVLYLMDKVLPLLNLKMKDNSSLYLFSSWKVIDIILPLVKKHFRVKNLLVWNKNNWSMGDLNSYAEKYEFIIYADKGNHKVISDKRPLNVLDFNRTTNKYHPTEKPVDLLEYLIKHSTIENELICDPFMGSGSSIIAAKNINRKYLGVEINKEYYETTLRRL